MPYLKATICQIPIIVSALYVAKPSGAAAKASVGDQAPRWQQALVLIGARGRSRTDTLLRAADFPPTSAFAALLEVSSQVRGLEHAFTVVFRL